MLIMSRTCCDCFLCKEHQIYSFPEYESPTRKSWYDNDPDYCIEHDIVSNSTKFREHTHVYNFQEREWNTLSNRRQDAGCVCVCVWERERERERLKHNICIQGQHNFQFFIILDNKILTQAQVQHCTRFVNKLKVCGHHYIPLLVW